MAVTSDHFQLNRPPRRLCAALVVVAAGLGALLSAQASAAGLTDLLAEDDGQGPWRIAGDRAELKLDDEEYSVDLVFALEKLRDEPTGLLVDTDADRLELRSDYRRVRLEFDKPGEHHLTLRASADEPLLQLDGQAVDADAQSDWQRLLERTDKPTLTLRLGKLTRASVSLAGNKAPRREGPPLLDEFGLIPLKPDSSGAGSADASTAPPGATEGVQLPAGSDPALGDAALVERARRSTLWVEAVHDDQAVARMALAVAIGKPGQIIMPAAWLGGASAVQARIDRRTTVDVVITALDAANDLALGQLDLADARWRGRVVPLAIGEPTTRSPIVAVRMDRQWQLQLARGSIIENYLTETLDEADRARLGATAGAHWLSLTAAVPATGSGGPVLNTRGRLVGLAAWACPSLDQLADPRNTTYQRSYRTRSDESDELAHRGWALSGSTVSALVGQVDQTPMTLGQVATTLTASNPSHYRLPLLRVTEPVPPTQLQRAVNAMGELLLCPLCRGAGVVTDRQRTGYRTEGTFRIPVYQDVESPCPRCEGAQLNSEQVIDRAVAQVADAAARADQADPRYPQISDHAIEKLRDLPGEHLPVLADQFNAQAMRSLVGGSLKPGDPLSVVGAVMPDGLGEDEQAAVRLVRLVGAGPGPGSDDQPTSPAGFAIIIHSDLVDPQIQSTVWVGGLFAGVIHTADGRLIPVIHGGFAIAADSALLPRDSTARTYRRQFQETRSTGERRPERR